MKKSLLIFWLSFQVLAPAISWAQSRQFFQFDLKSRRFPSNTDLETLSVSDTAIYQAFNFMSPKNQDMEPKSPIMLGVKFRSAGYKGSGFKVSSMNKVYAAYFLKDSDEVTVIALGINERNINDYQYRVVENDSSEITPWSKIPKLEQKYGAKKAYGFINKFKAPGKQLFLEVRNKRNYSIRDGVIFDWRRDFKPLLKQVNLTVKLNDTLFTTVLKDDQYKLGFTKLVDSKTNVPIDFKFKGGLVKGITLYFNNHGTVPYDIFISRKTEGDTLQKWLEVYSFTEDNKTIYDEFVYPGKYEIIVSRSESIGKSPEKDILRIPFEVLPGQVDSKAPPIELVIMLSLIVILLGLLIFLIYYNRSKRRLQKSKQEQQVAVLKLKSIRSQLNPHFMFNALTSIQNLINKNNIGDANFYLSKFAGLTRQVLDSNNENLLSLEDEVKMLTDYLEMEQLRFNFQFEMQVDPSLNQANIEVPAMLLQPFVENAVKHGVSGIHKGGKIQVIIKEIGADLEMRVQDNGGGYDQNAASSGYGIKLSEERVELLNQLYKDQSISLSTDSTVAGTVITIRLSNWIS
ncbi:two-component system LytT family sensor kinase [Pedobacter sp. UYP24]